MFISKLIANQMREPSGVIGRLVVGRGMNRTNAAMIDSTIELLDVKFDDRVLDIGFGGGGAMQQIVQLASAGLTAGVEKSAVMLQQARKKFRQDIDAGRIQIKEGAAEELPYDDGFFDKICTINCIYFWPEPASAMKEICRVLKPGGRVIISVYLKEEFEHYPPTRHGFRVYSDSELLSLLVHAGFTQTTIVHRTSTPYTSVFVIGTRNH